VAERVETELARARDAVAAAEAEAAERALARAEASLREHPELPQAAWLRAEIDRTWASRWMRLEPRDEARAQAAWADADALDGGRAAGVGEVAFAAPKRTPVSLQLLGVSLRSARVRLDGRELIGASRTEGGLLLNLEIAAAEHQLVITVDGELAFAGWVAVATPSSGATPQAIRVRVGDDSPCSPAALSHVTRSAGASLQAPGVTCGAWVAAIPADRRGAVLVARCAGSACGPFVEWRGEQGLDASGALGNGATDPPGSRRRAGGWPAWATWTALGVGVATATTLVLVARGAFESRPTEQRFVAGGVRIE
jgi:hypothetical protein